MTLLCSGCCIAELLSAEIVHVYAPKIDTSAQHMSLTLNRSLHIQRYSVIYSFIHIPLHLHAPNTPVVCIFNVLTTYLSVTLCYIPPSYPHPQSVVEDWEWGYLLVLPSWPLLLDANNCTNKHPRSIPTKNWSAHYLVDTVRHLSFLHSVYMSLCKLPK